MNSSTLPSKADHFFHALCAGAIGDAFGYNVEFDSYARIVDTYGPLGAHFSHDLNWSVSDDTQMTLFYLDALSQSAHLPTDAQLAITHQHFLFWLHTQKRRFNPLTDHAVQFAGSRLMHQHRLYLAQAPGNTCLSALTSGTKGTIEQPINDSKGCGAIMRTLPAAFFAHSAADAFEKGAAQGAITHGNPSGYLSAGLYAAVAFCLLQHHPVIDALSLSQSILTHYAGHTETLDSVQSAIRALAQPTDLQGPTLTAALGEGWTGHTALAVALYCALKAPTFEGCAQRAGNHDGDSDSTAMLACALWALLHPQDAQYMQYVPHLDIAPILNDCRRWLSDA